MKVCRNCNKEKEEKDFTKSKKGKNGLDTICLECNRKIAAEWYVKNKERALLRSKQPNYLEKKREDTSNRRKLVKDFIINYKKDKKCYLCGFSFYPILVFHHTNSQEKEFKISRYNSINVERLKKEIDKCILLCPNCHRELHYKETFSLLNINETAIKRRKYNEWFNSLKTKCSNCEESRFYVLDYHHVEEKNKNINILVNSRVAKNIILEELSKCILLCANCHQILHYKENYN